MTQNYIGVDLSQDRIDIFDPRCGHSQIPNRAAELKAWLGQRAPDDTLIFEATSGCDALIFRLASQMGCAFHRLNPLYGWHFSRSLNLPKTDRVDAAMLARLGAERQLEPSRGFARDRAELAELVARRDQIKRMETQEKNRLAKTSLAALRADIRSVLALLQRRRRKLEALIETFLRNHPELGQAVRRLLSIPSVGPVTAVTLVAHMPELGQLSRRAIASLGGLAPKARESGKWRGKRYLGDGRRHVRKALYMAAISAIRFNRICPDMVRRLRDKHKPGKVIVIALARKILTIANAMMREQTPFRTHP